MGERLLSPEELAALFRRLDSLIAEARTLQQQISQRLLATRRGDQQDRSGQPTVKQKTAPQPRSRDRRRSPRPRKG